MRKDVLWGAKQFKCCTRIEISKKFIFQNRYNVAWWTLKVGNCCVNISEWPFLVSHMSSSIQKPQKRGRTMRPLLLVSTTEWNLEQNIWRWRKPQWVGKIETSVVSSAGPLFKSLKSHTISQSIEIYIAGCPTSCDEEWCGIA